MATISHVLVHAKLGYSPVAGTQVKLSDLRTGGYTRDYSTSNWWRVNPYEVQSGNADDPDRGDNFHHLANWLGYDHDRLPAGSDVEDTGLGYGEVDIAWSAPNGATRAPELVGFRIYIKDTGLAHTSSPTETETSTNPTSTPDKTVDVGYGASVVEALNTSFSPEGNWVAVAVVSLFDDSNAEHEDSEGASAKTGEVALTGAFEGILAKVYDTAPILNSVTQTTDPDTCFAGEDVNISLDVEMYGASEGTLQRRTNGGSWSTIDSNVAAGSLTLTDTVASGNNYDYRLRYNDVSPNTWSAVKGTSATCNLV